MCVLRPEWTVVKLESKAKHTAEATQLGRIKEQENNWEIV